MLLQDEMGFTVNKIKMYLALMVTSNSNAMMYKSSGTRQSSEPALVLMSCSAASSQV